MESPRGGQPGLPYNDDYVGPKPEGPCAWRFKDGAASSGPEMGYGMIVCDPDDGE
jgi:hypothetical protein